MILGDLSILAEGGPVEVVPATEKIEEKVASATAPAAASTTAGSTKPAVRVD